MPPRKRAAPKPKLSAAERNCKLHCCRISDETGQRIKDSVEAGRGKSMFDQESRLLGANCRCGVPRKPPGISKYVSDDGLCVVHPDQPPQRWTRGAEGYGASTTDG